MCVPGCVYTHVYYEYYYYCTMYYVYTDIPHVRRRIRVPTSRDFFGTLCIVRTNALGLMMHCDVIMCVPPVSVCFYTLGSVHEWQTHVLELRVISRFKAESVA